MMKIVSECSIHFNTLVDNVYKYNFEVCAQ